MINTDGRVIVEVDCDASQARAVLQRALEAHLEGLKEAIGAATTDGTIDDPQDLADVTGDMSSDIEVGNKMLEALHDSD